jgi:hypothetical protein
MDKALISAILIRKFCHLFGFREFFSHYRRDHLARRAEALHTRKVEELEFSRISFLFFICIFFLW